MPRRSPAYAERITLAVRFVPAPASHFMPLVTMIQRLGYLDPQRAAIAGIESQTENDSTPLRSERKTQR